MDNEETMVENEPVDTSVDDTLEEGLAEEDESEESLDTITGDADDDGQPADDEPKEEQKGTTEPGWIRKRVDKAVAKAVAETEARMQAMFDQQMAPIREKMIEDEAQALVRSHKVADIETARELVRYRQGLPTQQSQTEAPAQQPRSANGQYAPKSDPVTQKQIDMLAHQADTIRETQGIDVIKVFRENAEINRAVREGRMDFYDVAAQMKQPPKKKPPAPVRSSNGASGATPNAIDTMSDAQFEKLERRIREGARYTLKT